ncbi:unnamed protein product [Gordionus sp. m RMFG-2023]
MSRLFNVSDYNCTVHQYKRRAKIVSLLFEYSAFIILILGIIGNSLGLYCAMRDQIKYIRVYLTRVFHAANLVNYILLLLYPILEVMGEFHTLHFGYQLRWNIYMSKYHFTIAKTLVNFSFGIYVIFAVTQMTAIVYPHYYKNYFTHRKIRIMLIVCFLYYLAWCIPAAWWFEILKLTNICGSDPNLIIYTLRIEPNKSQTERIGWTILIILTEIFTRFLPVAVILVLNYFSLKRKKLKIKWRSNYILSSLQETTSVNLNQAVILPEFEKNSSNIFIESREKRKKIFDSAVDTGSLFARHFNVAIKKPSDIGYDKSNDNQNLTSSISNTVNISNISKIGSKNDSKMSSQTQQKIKQMELEYKISIRMLAILMLQFVVFLFPVSIYLITIEFFDYETSGESDMALAGCTLLEYAYISFSFYLNMIFNPAYRKDVYRVFKRARICICLNKRLKNSVDVKSDIT